MRSNPAARITAGAVALTLLVSSAASAQIDTRFPTELGDSLVGAVVTSAYDDRATNDLILKTAADYHREMGGRLRTAPDPNAKPKKGEKEQPPGGWLSFPSVADAETLDQTVQDVVRNFRANYTIVSGGDGQANVSIADGATDGAAIIDLAQPAPCVTETGDADQSGVCAGDINAIPFNYTAIEFAVEDAAYLAGVVAAKASRGGRLGVVSGYPGCLECQRYVEGFSAGARAVDPDIDVVVGYLADDEASAFADSASARTYTEIFLDVYQPSVFMPVGRAVTDSMIEAACQAESEVLVVGTGSDIRSVRPDLECVMLSVTRDLPRAIEEALFQFSKGESQRVMTYDWANGGVGITDDWRERVAGLPVDTNEIYAAAEEAIRSGSVEACPRGCGESAG